MFDNKTKEINYEGRRVLLSMWYVAFYVRDTAGQEEYNQLRKIAYPLTDVFIVIFSVVDGDSFVNARKRVLILLSSGFPSSVHRYPTPKLCSWETRLT